jgi:hypothetical protein
VRLCRIARDNWITFDGWAAARGVDPVKLPFDRFLNLIYFCATDDAEEKEKDKFDVRLNLPDARARQKGAATSRNSPWSKANEESALGDFVSALSGKA